MKYCQEVKRINRDAPSLSRSLLKLSEKATSTVFIPNWGLKLKLVQEDMYEARNRKKIREETVYCVQLQHSSIAKGLME